MAELGELEEREEGEVEGSEHAFREVERQIMSRPSVAGMEVCPQLRPVAFDRVRVNAMRLPARSLRAISQRPRCRAAPLLEHIVVLIALV